MERNKFFVFCCAFVPGAGQMYLGMMKKGLTILTLFWGVIGVAVMLDLGVLCIFLPIIWFYSFFDTFNSARYNGDQRLMMDYKFWEDLKNGGWVPKIGIGSKVSGKAPKFLGLGCILLGVYSLYESIIKPMYWKFDLPEWLFFILNRIPNFVVAVAIIGLGIYLLNRERASKETEDFAEYQEGHHE